MHSQLEWLLTSKYYDNYVKELKAGNYYQNTTSGSIIDLLIWSKGVYEDWAVINKHVPRQEREPVISTKEVLSRLLPPDKYPEHYI